MEELDPMKIPHLFKHKNAVNSTHPAESKEAVHSNNDDIEQTIRNMSPEELRISKIWGTRAGFIEAMKKNDDFDAIAHLNALQELKDPDFSYFKGMYHFSNGDEIAAEKEFSLVSKNSEFYNLALKDLIDIFVKNGQYWKLSPVLQSADNLSNIVKFQHRLICLSHIKPEKLLPDRGRIIEAGFEVVDTMEQTEEDLHAYFEICMQFSNCLIAAHEMIKECSSYSERNKIKITSFENDENLSKIIHIYEHLVFILSLSSYFKLISINSNDGTTLAYCALPNYSWEDKIVLYDTQENRYNLANTILVLCNPNLHSRENRLKLIIHNAYLLAHVDSWYIQCLIAHEYDILSEAVQNGNVEALQLFMIAYGDILANNTDRFGLKQRLQATLSEKADLEKDITIVARKLSATMSRNALKALTEAEQDYETAKKQNMIKDASRISLGYFRVIEMELNYKLIIPLVENLDFDQLEQSCGYNKAPVDRTPYESELYKKWNKDIYELNKVRSSCQDTLELGTIRTLLYHIMDDDRHDLCSRLLDNALTPLLSLDGLHAFRSKTMMGIISRENTEKYRVPGSHTGYHPLSTAKEAREFVLTTLPLIESWFKQGQ